VCFDLHLNLETGLEIGPGAKEPVDREGEAREDRNRAQLGSQTKVYLPSLARLEAHRIGYSRTRARPALGRRPAAPQSLPVGCRRR
jgi:hypothetical protein